MIASITRVQANELMSQGVASLPHDELQAHESMSCEFAS